MRIGMMADVYKPHVSGITHFIELTKRQLEDGGHEVYVFAFGPDHDDAEPRITRSPGVPLPNTEYYFALRHSTAARRLLQTMDVVHIHHPFLSGQLAIRYCRPLGIPMVFTNHTRYDLYAGVYLPLVPKAISAAFVGGYMRRFCGAMDLVVVPSSGIADLLRGMGFGGRIDIISNGVEVQRFYGAKPLPRADFGFSDADVVLVYAGRVAGEKDLPFLLQAFARVARTADNVRLAIIGGGPPQVEGELRDLVRRLDLSPRVVFTGMVPYQSLPSYLVTCDVFVTASVSESLPLSMIEAMASGLPVVAIRSPGISELVEDGRTGALVTHDLDSFTARLERMCADTPLRKQMSAAARQASTKFSVERTTETLVERYEQLVRSRERRA